ncbi:hypothetical protein LC040_08930 [Bacillus tianshenii]|nr:hypothetical protein LC040_08930 [Bacillus tianshenii]
MTQMMNEMPKSIKRAVRYIRQDAPVQKLHSIRELVDEAIKMRQHNEKRNS